MKVSEMFQDAIDKKIPQARGVFRVEIEGQKTSYCVIGLYAYSDMGRATPYGEWVKFRDRAREETGFYLRQLNDSQLWTWEQFRDLALTFEGKNQK
jgi:hypothetical protein